MTVENNPFTGDDKRAFELIGLLAPTSRPDQWWETSEPAKIIADWLEEKLEAERDAVRDAEHGY